MASARPIASGTISFGLVTVPIRLYSATESSSGPVFNLLHAKCGSRLKQQYVCPKDGDVLTRDLMVKGYEFAKDQYVVFTEDELKALAEESNRGIEIVEFLPVARVDPVYFEGAYYVGPDKGGDRAYVLLAEAMRRTGRCGLARWSTRGKQHLVMIRAAACGLVLQVLYHAGEVRSFAEVPLGDAAPPKPAELKLAVQLIQAISSETFRPEVYRDEVRLRCEEAIQRKVEGKEVALSTPPEAPRASNVIDLMSALKASMARAGKAGKPRRPPKRAAAALTPRRAASGR